MWPTHFHFYRSKKYSVAAAHRTIESLEHTDHPCTVSQKNCLVTSCPPSWAQAHSCSGVQTAVWEASSMPFFPLHFTSQQILQGWPHQALPPFHPLTQACGLPAGLPDQPLGHTPPVLRKFILFKQSRPCPIPAQSPRLLLPNPHRSESTCHMLLLSTTSRVSSAHPILYPWAAAMLVSKSTFLIPLKMMACHSICLHPSAPITPQPRQLPTFSYLSCKAILGCKVTLRIHPLLLLPCIFILSSIHASARGALCSHSLVCHCLSTLQWNYRNQAA